VLGGDQDFIFTFSNPALKSAVHTKAGFGAHQSSLGKAAKDCSYHRKTCIDALRNLQGNLICFEFVQLFSESLFVSTHFHFCPLQ
jgi:hypothetical protein